VNKDEMQRALELVDELRKRGATQVKIPGEWGTIEATFGPTLLDADPFDALTKPIDATKCSTCQVAPPEQRYSGQCRACYLRSAGESTSLNGM